MLVCVFIRHFNRLQPASATNCTALHCTHISSSADICFWLQSNYIDEHLLTQQRRWLQSRTHCTRDAVSERKANKNRTLNLCCNQFAQATCSNWICILHFWCIRIHPKCLKWVYCALGRSVIVCATRLFCSCISNCGCGAPSNSKHTKQ